MKKGDYIGFENLSDFMCWFQNNLDKALLRTNAGCDSINIYIIIAYYPDTKKFGSDLKTRRKGKSDRGKKNALCV